MILFYSLLCPEQEIYKRKNSMEDIVMFLKCISYFLLKNSLVFSQILITNVFLTCCIFFLTKCCGNHGNQYNIKRNKASGLVWVSKKKKFEPKNDNSCLSRFSGEMNCITLKLKTIIVFLNIVYNYMVFSSHILVTRTLDLNVVFFFLFYVILDTL